MTLFLDNQGGAKPPPPPTVIKFVKIQKIMLKKMDFFVVIELPELRLCSLREGQHAFLMFKGFLTFKHYT